MCAAFMVITPLMHGNTQLMSIRGMLCNYLPAHFVNLLCLVFLELTTSWTITPLTG